MSTTRALNSIGLRKYSGAMIRVLEASEFQQEDKKSVQEVSSAGTTRRRGKTHTDFWLKKVYLPKFSTAEGPRESSLYSVKLQHAGRRESIPLHTSNVAEAARKAKLIWATVTANGWEKALFQFKPRSHKPPTEFTTIGAYLDFLEEKNLFPKDTLYNQAGKLYTTLGFITGKAKPSFRFDRRNGGSKKWKAMLGEIRLSELNPQRIEEFKNRYLAERSDNPVDLERAKHTLDSYLRASKALFGPRLRKRLSILGASIPEPVPFAATEFATKGRSAFRYRSRMDPHRLTQQALDELTGERSEQLKIFLLALHLGLRRNEIDKLLWQQFDFDAGVLTIEETEYAALKSPGSAGSILVEPELRDFFRSFWEKRSSIFVVGSEVTPRKTTGWRHYRAHKHHTLLCEWLRGKGISADKPIHTLRKEFGRMITEKMGIFAASLALRHSSTAVTVTYYADDTRPKHTGLGSLLKPYNEASHS